MNGLNQISEVEWEIPQEGKMRVPVRAFGELPIIQKMSTDRTFLQARNVATLPGIVAPMCVMPDGHEGYGFPIGGVAAFDMEEGVVSPGGIGYDINCGVRLLRTDISFKDLQPRIKQLVPTLFNAIPSGVGSKGRIRVDEKELEHVVTQGAHWAVDKGYGVKEDLEHAEEGAHAKDADYSKVSAAARKRGAPQIGTLGSGNHFVEVQRIERVYDQEAAKAFGLVEGNVTVMIHSGSRGFGHQICDDYLKIFLAALEKNKLQLADRELSCAPLDSKEAEDYFGAMRSAMNFAFNNRHMMAHWARGAFEDVFKQDWEKLGIRTLYDVCHNIAKVEEHEIEGKKRKVCVHRKGATRAYWAGKKELPADYRNVGQPVLIPGSMGTASYVLCGLPTSSKSFGTTAHGAGRVMSRHAAIREWGHVDLKGELQKKGITVQSTGREVVAEEAPGAYKDVDAVVRSTQTAGISKIVARLVPVGVVKG